jgi:ribonuclease P protein component
LRPCFDSRPRYCISFVIKAATIKRRFTWKRAEKLKSRKLIERVFREGKSFSVHPFRVFYLAMPPFPAVPPVIPSTLSLSLHKTKTGPAVIPPLLAGFGATTRNFKRAVDRNRIKRLSREAYRLQKQALYDHLSAKNRSLAIFFIYTGKEVPDYGIVTEKIAVALQKLIKETGQ